MIAYTQCLDELREDMLEVPPPYQPADSFIRNYERRNCE